MKRTILTILGILILQACASNPDHIGPYQIHIYNETEFELNWHEVDYLVAETVRVNGGDTLRLNGFQISIVDYSISPNDGRHVGGWVKLNGGGVGEVEYASGKCFSSTAFAHELLHILRGIHGNGPGGNDHSNDAVWGAIDIASGYRLIGFQQAIKRRSGKRYCDYDDDLLDTPGHWEKL